jgi:hypothetical protein
MPGSVNRAKTTIVQIMDRLDKFQMEHQDDLVALELSEITRELAFTLQHLLESAREPRP